MSLAQPLSSHELHKVILERDRLYDTLHNGEPGVTVCIPTHNDAVTLVRALDSVLGQTYRGLVIEIIIVDDGSDDPAAVQDAIGSARGDAGVRYVRVTNRGLPAARNVGLMLARGRGFLPLDADDWLDERYLESTFPLLAEADVVLTGLQEHGPHRNGTYFAGFDRPFDAVDEAILWEYNRYFYCSLFRTSLLREVGGYNARMAGWPGVVHGGYEDWDLWIDLKRRGARFAAVNEPLFNYDTSKPESMLARAESNRHLLVEEMHRHHP